MNDLMFDYYFFFKSRFKWLIIIPVLFGLLGILYAALQSHKYIAELTFVSNGSDNNNPYSLLMQQVGIDVGSSSDAFEGDNLIEFLKTRSLIEQTLLTPVTIKNKRQLLVDYYMDQYKIKEKWNKPGSVLQGVQFFEDRSKFSLLQDSALKLIYQQIEPTLAVGKPDKKLSIVSIDVTGQDQNWAKSFAETLVSNATKLYIKSKTAKLQENVNILQAKVDSINGRVSGSLSNIATTQDINVNPNKKTSQISIQKQQINLQVDNAVLAELIKNLELAKIQLSKQTPFIEVLDHPILPLDDKKPGKLISSVISAFTGGLLTIVFFAGQIQYAKFKQGVLAQQRFKSET